MPLLRDAKDTLGSPYLAQHADNPVDWWSWGLDALERARDLDRPIFLSIGYASCHWCHVMAHESFEDPAIARLLNDSFISVKVDREERPDVDALYMAATQLVSGHGGWPMSVFLLPDGRPFMAGTYYPPQDRHGQVGFSRLLSALVGAWNNQRDAVVSQAIELQEAIEREVSFVDRLASPAEALDLRSARRVLRDELVARVDAEGGFGDAPKFPRPSFVEALLDSGDDESRSAVTRTLDAMSRRGLYDHLRGGFARYSVDAEWHVPHFEKMLSDQALLARAYLLAARRVPTHPEWRDVALDTLSFVVSDLRVGASYASSLDADAGGIEGSHVTWSVAEVASVLERAGLSADLGRVLARWQITDPGFFEGRSIPRLGAGEPFVTPDELRPARDALRAARAERVQPGRDEKVILEWNAMFASSCLLSGERDMVARGLELLESLPWTHFEHATWWRTEHREAHASASDVAWLLDARLEAFEATGEDRWLEASRELAEYLLSHYWDGEVPTSKAPHVGAGLFSSSDLVADLRTRPKEIFDGATPSSHAVACRALARLALLDGDAGMLCVAQRLVEIASAMIVAHPSAVPDLVLAAGFALEGVEIVVPGEANELSDHVRLMAMSDSVLITGSGSSPLLRGREAGLAYVCRAGVCELPARSIDELDEQLARARR
jgi:uncharacterized protein YyaL (SSP411 family)